MLHDPRPQRVSACPVHFLWDGRGLGRAPVRAGFLGFLAAGALATGAVALRTPDLAALARWTALAALLSYGAGQIASLVEARRAAR